jgi:UPF0755 protein
VAKHVEDPQPAESPSADDASAVDVDDRWEDYDDPYDDDRYDDDWIEDDDQDFVYVPEDRGIVRKVMAVFVCLLLFVVMVLGLGGYWLYSQVNPGGDGGAPVVLVIPNDAGLATISRLLEEQSVISNATIFRYYAKWKNIPTIKAGEYDRFTTHEPMDDVIERLKQGPLPPKYTEVSIPEGLWVQDATAKIKEKFPDMTDAQILAALGKVRSKYQAKDKSVVGFLFPATYRVEDPDKADAEKLLDQMTKKFDQVGDEIGLADPASHIGAASGKVPISSYDVVTIASLIEGEAKVPEDRARIARVIYNRLKAGMPLGIDAAQFVAIGQHKPELSKSDLAVDSPYNLRKYAGLPPTPINSPGRDSLVAALNPSTEPGADTWLYYVLSDKAGHHTFVATQQQFDAAVAKAKAAGLI